MSDEIKSVSDIISGYSRDKQFESINNDKSLMKALNRLETPIVDNDVDVGIMFNNWMNDIRDNINEGFDTAWNEYLIKNKEYKKAKDKDSFDLAIFLFTFLLPIGADLIAKRFLKKTIKIIETANNEGGFLRWAEEAEIAGKKLNEYAKEKFEPFVKQASNKVQNEMISISKNSFQNMKIEESFVLLFAKEFKKLKKMEIEIVRDTVRPKYLIKDRDDVQQIQPMTLFFGYMESYDKREFTDDYYAKLFTERIDLLVKQIFTINPGKLHHGKGVTGIVSHLDHIIFPCLSEGELISIYIPLLNLKKIKLDKEGVGVGFGNSIMEYLELLTNIKIKNKLSYSYSSSVKIGYNRIGGDLKTEFYSFYKINDKVRKAAIEWYKSTFNVEYLYEFKRGKFLKNKKI